MCDKIEVDDPVPTDGSMTIFRGNLFFSFFFQVKYVHRLIG